LKCNKIVIHHCKDKLIASTATSLTKKPGFESLTEIRIIYLFQGR